MNAPIPDSGGQERDMSTPPYIYPLAPKATSVTDQAN
jgi:hypothetical protein